MEAFKVDSHLTQLFRCPGFQCFQHRKTGLAAHQRSKHGRSGLLHIIHAVVQVPRAVTTDRVVENSVKNHGSF